MPILGLIFRKHDFGPGPGPGRRRYVTLMVRHANDLRNGAVGSMLRIFGTEPEVFPNNVHHRVDSLEDGCMIADAKFSQLFPLHLCGDACMLAWHPSDSMEEGSASIQ